MFSVSPGIVGGHHEKRSDVEATLAECASSHFQLLLHCRLSEDVEADNINVVILALAYDTEKVSHFQVAKNL